MNNEFKKVWENYAAAWGAATAQEKRQLFERSLDPDCTYTDPLQQTRGWDELTKYMLEFHRQIPGGHFVTKHFLAHHRCSIARWEMKNGKGITQGEGISYGTYNDQGRLTSMTGFFEAPEDSPSDSQ